MEEDDDVGIRSGLRSVTEESDAWLCLCPPWSVIQSSMPLWSGMWVVAVMSDSEEGDWPIVEFPLLLINFAVIDPFLSSCPIIKIFLFNYK